MNIPVDEVDTALESVLKPTLTTSSRKDLRLHHVPIISSNRFLFTNKYNYIIFYVINYLKWSPLSFEQAPFTSCDSVTTFPCPVRHPAACSAELLISTHINMYIIYYNKLYNVIFETSVTTWNGTHAETAAANSDLVDSMRVYLEPVSY